MRARRFICALFFVAIAAAQNNDPGGRPGAPSAAATNAVVSAMFRLAGVKKTDVVYDLGCGDGRIVIAAAKTFGARGVGVDINPQRVQEANGNARKEGVQDLVRFEENDMFDADIHDATVVTLYLLPDLNMRLRPKLLRDLKPGTRVVSHSFAMGDWKPDKQEDAGGDPVFLWTVPEKR